MPKIELIQGDCLEKMRNIPDGSIDAVITDPPYFLINNNGSGFMNKEWDSIIGLWRYLLCEQNFVNTVARLLKSVKVERNLIEECIVQENVNIKELREEKNLNVQSVPKFSPFSTVLKNASVHLIALTKEEVLDSLRESLGNHIKMLEKSLNGVEKNALFVVPILLQEVKEHNNIVARSVIKLLRVEECQQREITFTKTEMQKIKNAIVAMSGGLYGKGYTKEISGVADFVESTVEGTKYSVIISSPTNKVELMKNLILLLYAMFVMQGWKGIQQSLIFNFFKTIFSECTRVLKPGGYLLSFGGTRTYHRMACAIEDAGFEIRNQLIWAFGSGFPKSTNIYKQLQKIGSDRADEFNGFGTQLKPAFEPICMSMKPLSEKNFALNCLKWGTGGINIDECRVELEENSRLKKGGSYSGNRTGSNAKSGFNSGNKKIEYTEPPGRFPANLILSADEDGQVSEEVRECFPDVRSGGRNIKTDCGNAWYKQNVNADISHLDSSGNASRFFKSIPQGRFPANLILGADEDGQVSEEVRECFPESKSTIDKSEINRGTSKSWFTGDHVDRVQRGDSGNASRFFKSIIYQAKASKAERNKGCEGLEEKYVRRDDGQPYGTNTNKYRPDGSERKPVPPKANNHPTVKPIALMEYLIKMVTPKGATVLDPFMGSGTTGVACKNLNRNFIGIEKSAEYFKIAKQRINNS